MTPDTFTDIALPFVWRPENDGQSFHNDPRDPGGATSWGVTFSTWSGWQRMHSQSAAFATFHDLARDAFAPLYRTLFWQAVRGDEVHPAVAVSLFDAAVGSAPRHAIEFLQSVLGVDQDGVFGNVETMPAVRSHDPADIVQRLWKARDAFYEALPTFRIYGNGWERRAADCERLSLSLITAPPDPTRKDSLQVVDPDRSADALMAAEQARDAG